MAINLTDFDKIWASTSPLTPYSFSDANYQQGWNFVGATPPARQMWDSYMKWSDEKQQYIVQNFLPLSGGTMTGNISFDETEGRVGMSVSQNEAGRLRLLGGSGITNGAQLLLSGKSNTSTAGQFQLGANDGTDSASLLGKPDGTLTWGGKSVIVGTEASETFSNVSVGASASLSVGTLSHTAKYYSIFMTGIGFASISVVIGGDQKTIWARNIDSVARTITFIVNYIY